MPLSQGRRKVPEHRDSGHETAPEAEALRDAVAVNLVLGLDREIAGDGGVNGHVCYTVDAGRHLTNEIANKPPSSRSIMPNANVAGARRCCM